MKVVSEASGESCSDAIDVAKKIAVESANGSYISSKQVLDTGLYSEHISELSGGYVESYVVLHQAQGSTCKVKIEAIVRSQYNEITESADRKLDLSGYKKIVRQQGGAEQAIVNSFAMYPLAISGQVFDINTQQLVVGLVPQTKFLEDAEGILRTLGAPRVFKSGLSSVLSGFGKRRELKYAFDGGFCFVKDSNTLHCYDMPSAKFGVNLTANGEPLHTNPVRIFAFDLVDTKSRYCDENICSERFPIASNRKVSSQYETKQSTITIEIRPWN